MSALETDLDDERERELSKLFFVSSSLASQPGSFRTVLSLARKAPTAPSANLAAAYNALEGQFEPVFSRTPSPSEATALVQTIAERLTHGESAPEKLAGKTLSTVLQQRLSIARPR